MQKTGIIIIGGGAAGLMAAYSLCKAGRQVTLLEARDRLGGRIHTLENGAFSYPAEGGAEFVHGNLPVSLSLLNEAGIQAVEAGGEFWKVKEGRLTKEASFLEESSLLMEKLDALQEDEPIAAFLREHFAGERYKELRDSVKGFVEGYDAADLEKASAFALREEWEGEDDQQYRPAEGYAPMIRFLENACRQHGAHIALNAVVRSVQWERSNVEVITDNGKHYTAAQLIVTLPLSLLQSQPPSTGTVLFEPALPGKMEAARLIGMGHVIKLLFEFTAPFWLDAPATRGADASHAAFFFSHEVVPTWWTQYPRRSNLLTGWLAGPKAEAHAGSSNETLIEEGLVSLSHIFQVPLPLLREQLVQTQVFNWSADPFSRGAYAYNTVQTVQARKTLLEPEAGTLFFAGEALYEGKEMGTVEAALASGKKAAETLLEGTGLKG